MTRRADWALPVALVGLLLWVALFWSGPLINDAAWQMWIGRQLNGGDQLYRDILEVNPPLWFWIGAGFEQVAAATGVVGIRCLLIGFALYAAVSLWLTFRLLPETRDRWAAGAGLLAALFVTSPYAHLQREQFLLIAVLPYVALQSRRAGGEKVAVGLAVAAGLLAAPGLALKHHFLLLPVLLEAWVISRQRRVTVRPEHVTLAAAAILYAAAVMVVTPDYITSMLPLLRASYHGYNPPFFALFSQPGLIAALCLVAAALIGRRQLGSFGMAAALGAAAFVLSYLLQGKSFHYQAIPALGLATIAGISLLLARPDGPAKPQGRLIAVVGLALLVWVPLKSGGSRFDRVFNAATAGLGRGKGVAMLSASQALAWPAVYERELRWGSRTMGLWMMLSPWQAELKGENTPDMVALGTAVRRELAAEIACGRPAIVLSDTRYDENAPGGDQTAWFFAEPRFAAAMRGYREEQAVGYLRRFVRLAGTAEAGACHREDLRALSRALGR